MLYLRYLLIAFIFILFIAAIGQFVTNAMEQVNPFINLL